jgi:hypothetical protein
MASSKRQRLERLLQEMEEAEYSWLFEKGLAGLLPYLTDDAGDANDDYADCEGAPGLRGLLYYVDPRTERPANYVTE